MRVEGRRSFSWLHAGLSSPGRGVVEVERCGQGLDSLRDRAVGFADGQGVVWRERKGTLSTARLSTEQLDIVEGGMVGGSCLDRKLAFGEGHLQCLGRAPSESEAGQSSGAGRVTQWMWSACVGCWHQIQVWHTLSMDSATASMVPC